MTLEQLDQENEELRQQIADLEQQLRECRDRRENAAQVLAAEQGDVDRLEGMSLAYVFHTILGNRVEHLDKERREALAAHLSHQQALRDEADVAAFARGMTLGDGTECLPAGLEPLEPGRCRVTLFEGKYHQVKRMLAARGKPVTALHRQTFGPLSLEAELFPGQCRLLTEGEVNALREAVRERRETGKKFPESY